MKRINILRLSFLLTLFLNACSKENGSVINESSSAAALNSTRTSGAVQLSGTGYYASAAECDYQSEEAAYAIRMTGDLQGCLYAFIDDFECSPSGTYREEGREYFVGTYNGQTGTFWTTYRFEARYEGCEGGPLGAEIFGRCQHPIVAGSGTGVFDGVTGQLNFKDDIAAGNFPYRGHLRF
jgi:hypothetical protein